MKECGNPEREREPSLPNAESKIKSDSSCPRPDSLLDIQQSLQRASLAAHEGDKNFEYSDDYDNEPSPSDVQRFALRVESAATGSEKNNTSNPHISNLANEDAVHVYPESLTDSKDDDAIRDNNHSTSRSTSSEAKKELGLERKRVSMPSARRKTRPRAPVLGSHATRAEGAPAATARLGRIALTYPSVMPRSPIPRSLSCEF